MQNSSITAYCIKMKQDMLYLMNFYAYQNAFTMDQQRLQILNQFKTNIKIANLTVLLRKMKERSLFFGKSNMFLIVLGLLIIASYCGYSQRAGKRPWSDPGCHEFSPDGLRCCKCSDRYIMGPDGCCKKVSDLCKDWCPKTGVCTCCYKGWTLKWGQCCIGEPKPVETKPAFHFPQAKPAEFGGKYIKPDHRDFFDPKPAKNFGPKFGAGHWNKPNYHKPSKQVFQHPRVGKYGGFKDPQPKVVKQQPWNNQYQKPSSPRNSFDARFNGSNQNNVNIKNTFNPKIDIPIVNNVVTNVNLGYQKVQANVNQPYNNGTHTIHTINLDETKIQQAIQKLKNTQKPTADLPKPQGINLQALGRRD